MHFCLQNHRGRARATVACCAMLVAQAFSAKAQRPTTLPVDQATWNDCRYGSWSPPRSIESPTPMLAALHFFALALEPPPANDEQRAATRMPTGYVVGNAGYLAIEFARRGWPLLWPPRLRTFRLDGVAVAAPTGQFWFAHPRAAVDARGTLHVVWAEPDEAIPPDPATLDGRTPTLRSLWYATLRAGKWNRAERIYRADELQWDEYAASRLLVDARDSVHIAFAGRDSSHFRVIYLSGSGAPGRPWHARTWKRFGTSYLDLALDSGGRVALAIIDGSTSSDFRPNVLFLTRSGDWGRTWTDFVEVTERDTDPAIEPHVFFDRNAGLHLSWVQRSLGGFTGGGIWHATITEANRPLATFLALPEHEMTSHSRAALDGCGTLHVVTQLYRNGRSEFMYARTTRTGWSEWSHPFSLPGGQAVLVARGDQLHIVWSTTARTVGDSTWRSKVVHASLPILQPRPQ